ncbi:MAG: hypothetical protein GY756_22900 [bacterium]|nr:hypothetical protein [bacterium]
MEKETVRNLFSELMLKCPFSRDNPMNCAMHKLRKLSFFEKMKFIEKLSQKDYIDLYDNHAKCLTERSSI